MPSLDGIAAETERLAAAQSTYQQRVLDAVDELIGVLGECEAQLSSLASSSSMGNDDDDDAARSALLERSVRTTARVSERVLAEQRRVWAGIKRLSAEAALTTPNSVLDEAVSPSVHLDARRVFPQIAQHLYREGHYDLAEHFVAEAGVHMPAEHREPFRQLQHVLRCLHEGQLSPAIEWASSHREALAKSGSQLEFQLHALEYLGRLKAGRVLDALSYAREHFGRFAGGGGGGGGGGGTTENNGGGAGGGQFEHIKRLMVCLAYAQRLETSAYAAEVYASAPKCSAVAREFTREFCSDVGLSRESALLLIVLAGLKALPQMIKAARKTAERREWHKAPVEVKLGRDFHFHSIFVCPVSRGESSPDNPPLMLPCAHVLCRSTVLTMDSETGGQPFRCPYCNAEANAATCQTLYFA